MLFLYTQTDEESVVEFTRNFKSFWDMVEVFGGSPGVHKRLVNVVLAKPGRVEDPNNVTVAELKAAEEDTTKAVKAVLLVSRAEKRR